MKKPALLLPLLLLQLLFIKVNASHMMGGELTYKWVSGNTYTLRLSVYRDCAGIAVTSSHTVDVGSINAGSFFTVQLFSTDTLLMYEACPGGMLNTSCFNGTDPGYQNYIYEGNVTLPSNQTDWKFRITECCRNGQITNLVDPDTYGFVVAATLNNQNGPNSSPNFSTPPVIIIQANEIQRLSWNAYDPDGDEIEYHLTVPLDDNGPIPFAAGFAADWPFGISAFFEFDSLAGSFTVNSNSTQVVVVSMLVTEKRNGVFVGEVRRDLQMLVLNQGTNHSPSATGFNGTNNFEIYANADSVLSFEIWSDDIDTSQQLSIAIDSTLLYMGATVTGIGSGLHPGLKVTWTPDSAAQGSDKVFTVIVRDDNCPFNSVQSFTYTIHVLPSTQCRAYFTLHPDVSTPHNWFALNQCSGTGPLNYLWTWGDGDTSTGPAPSHVYQSPGYYNICVSVTDSTLCTSTYCDSSTYVYKTDASMVSVNVVDSLPASTPTVGVEELADIIAVYPNPLYNGNWVVVTPAETIGSDIKLFNMEGRLIKTLKVHSARMEVNADELYPGIYFLKVGTSVARLLKF